MSWLKASYHFHSYCYRDPRSVYSSGVGVPVVSPTTVYLGIASSLYRLGKNEEAEGFLKSLTEIEILIDAPDAVIFFRAFHQVRRYQSGKWDKNNPRIGFTQINQATKEYGLVQGCMTLFVKVPEKLKISTSLALGNLTHLGTKDSLCSISGNVESTDEPVEVVYCPSSELEQPTEVIKKANSVTMITLSRFKK